VIVVNKIYNYDELITCLQNIRTARDGWDIRSAYTFSFPIILSTASPPLSFSVWDRFDLISISYLIVLF